MLLGNSLYNKFPRETYIFSLPSSQQKALNFREAIAILKDLASLKDELEQFLATDFSISNDYRVTLTYTEPEDGTEWSTEFAFGLGRQSVDGDGLAIRVSTSGPWPRFEPATAGDSTQVQELAGRYRLQRRQGRRSSVRGASSRGKRR